MKFHIPGIAYIYYVFFVPHKLLCSGWQGKMLLPQTGFRESAWEMPRQSAVGKDQSPEKRSCIDEEYFILLFGGGFQCPPQRNSHSYFLFKSTNLRQYSFNLRVTSQVMKSKRNESNREVWWEEVTVIDFWFSFPRSEMLGNFYKSTGGNGGEQLCLWPDTRGFFFTMIKSFSVHWKGQSKTAVCDIYYS